VSNRSCGEPYAAISIIAVEGRGERPCIRTCRSTTIGSRRIRSAIRLPERCNASPQSARTGGSGLVLTGLGVSTGTGGTRRHRRRRVDGRVLFLLSFKFARTREAVVGVHAIIEHENQRRYSLPMQKHERSARYLSRLSCQRRLTRRLTPRSFSRAKVLVLRPAVRVITDHHDVWSASKATSRAPFARLLQMRSRGRASTRQYGIRGRQRPRSSGRDYDPCCQRSGVAYRHCPTHHGVEFSIERSGS